MPNCSKNRWCILTPPEGTDAQAVKRLASFWSLLGANVEIMTPEHHDLVLAVTSHLPHLIAYTIVGTADELETVTRSEVLKFSAGGFRDFTRIAASDPVMWRDIFLANKDAVLEMLGRFNEDVAALTKAIRRGDGDALVRAVHPHPRHPPRHHRSGPGHAGRRFRPPPRPRRLDVPFRFHPLINQLEDFIFTRLQGQPCTASGHSRTIGPAVMDPSPRVKTSAKVKSKNPSPQHLSKRRAVTVRKEVPFASLAQALTALRPDDAQARLFGELNRCLDVALNNMGRGLSMFDAEARLIVCNKLYREIYSLPKALTRPGTPLAAILRYHVKNETGRDDPQERERQRKWIKTHVAELALGKSFSHTQSLKNGRIVLVSNQPLAGGGWVDIQEDITERRQAENKIDWLARHDTLTEVANRHQFNEQLEKWSAALQDGHAFALHWIDLDHFKEVNDTLGHPAGDALLKSVANRVRKVLRGTDLVGRLGGDEFAILQAGATDQSQATKLVERLQRTLAEPHRVLGHQVTIGASIGIALAPKDGCDPEVLMKKADLALYDAKTSGRSTYAFCP